MTYEVYDHERGCGWRKEGGIYLVSTDNSAVGRIPVGEEATGFIRISPPIPIDPDTVQKRGFIYVDGEALLRIDRTGPRVAASQISKDLAEARAFSWRIFGVDWPDRGGRGVCQGLLDPREARARLEGLEWQDRGAWQETMRAIQALIEEARTRRDDVTLLPLIVAAHHAYEYGIHEQMEGYGMLGAGGALASAWRLLHAARWVGEERGAQWTSAYLMSAAGALTDVVHASRYRPARWRLPPDILDWVGERHYPTAADFAREAKRYGISRRMPGVPKAIVPPYSRAFFAHARCEWPAEERVGLPGSPTICFASMTVGGL